MPPWPCLHDRKGWQSTATASQAPDISIQLHACAHACWPHNSTLPQALNLVDLIAVYSIHYMGLWAVSSGNPNLGWHWMQCLVRPPQLLHNHRFLPTEFQPHAMGRTPQLTAGAATSKLWSGPQPPHEPAKPGSDVSWIPLDWLHNSRALGNLRTVMIRLQPSAHTQEYRRLAHHAASKSSPALPPVCGHTCMHACTIRAYTSRCLAAPALKSASQRLVLHLKLAVGLPVTLASL